MPPEMGLSSPLNGPVPNPSMIEAGVPAGAGESLNGQETSDVNMPPKTTLVDSSLKRNSVRKRACKPKVRTGCVTCKVRRVKCDEGKPECRRCMVFGIRCDGYGLTPTAVQLDARQLQPRSSPSPDMLDIRNPSRGTLFQTEKEHHYFLKFQDEIAAGLSGTLETSLWNHLMLQACHDEPFVRNAVVAISALNTSKSLDYSISSNEIVAKHKEFALQQYELAIRTMRVSLSRSVENSPRKALIACLLVCCFESLSGNYFNTLGHAKSGHQLMRDWLAKFPPSLRRLDGIASPAPEIIEDDLIRAFTRLDHQVVTFFDSRTADVHAELKDFGSSAVDNMPATFANVDEASHYLVLIQARKCHFIYASSKGWLNDVSPDAIPLPPGPEPSLFFLEQRKYTMEFLRWAAAFEPLYQQLRNSTDARLRLAACTMYCNCKISSVTLNSIPDPNSCSFDKHISDFRAITAICRNLVDEFYRPGTRRPQPYFVMNHGLIVVLHTINMFCRDRRLRREGISLLRQMNCREGVWDSNMMAEMDEKLMEVEENGVETYYIPAKSRVTKLKVNIGTEDKKASIECVKNPRERGSEVLEFRQNTVEIERVDWGRHEGYADEE